MGQRRPRDPHCSKGLAVIRTSAACARFLGFACLVAELHQTVGRSPVLRGSGDFISFSWIKPKSTPARPSHKAWRLRATSKAGSTFALALSLMASPTLCPTCQNSWEAVLPKGMSEYPQACSPNAMRALIPIAALIVSTALPALAQRPLPKVGSCPYSYRSSGDYCMLSKSSKDAFIRTGNSCPNSYRKSGRYCIAN